MLQNNTLIQRIRRFSLNGVFVTLLDFGVLNVLAAFGVWYLIANIISTSVAVIVSYKINKKWVFQSNASSHTFLLFLAITLFGSYVLQGVVLFLFSEYGVAIGEIMRQTAMAVGIDLSADFWLLNTAKIAATVVTAVWNFILYQRFVFVKVAT